MKSFSLLIFFLLFQVGLAAQSIGELDRKADSLYYYQSDYYTAQEYKAEIALRDKVLNHFTDSTSQDYKSAQVKKFASQASYLIHEMNYKEAIDLSEKALKFYEQVEKQNLLLKGMIYKKVYYAYSATKEFETTDNYVKKAREILRDTLGDVHPILADIEFDLGQYVYGRLGDYDKVIEQYKKGIAIAVETLGENSRKAAIQEHHLALVYGFIGYYQKELESYLKVISRWEALKEHPDKSYLAIAYGSVSTWYRYHGDVEKAQYYLNKRLELVQEHKHTIKDWFNETYLGRTQIETWDQLAHFNLYLGDTAKALSYHEMIDDYFKDYNFEDPKNNPHKLPYSKSWAKRVKINRKRTEAKFYEMSDPLKAISLYEQLINDRKAKNYNWSSLDIIRPLHLLYLKKNRIVEAERILEKGLQESITKTKTFDIMHYKAASANVKFRKGDVEKMRKLYVEAFSSMLKDKNNNIDLSTHSINDCKPFGDLAVVDFTILAANNFFKSHQNNKVNNDLKIAHNLNKLSSAMFSENFAHMIFTDQNASTAQAIFEQLLQTSLALKETDIKIEALERIENMSSRISWKRFLHSQMSERLDVPDSLLERESDLRSKLHFYKKRLFTDKELSSEKKQLFKDKIQTAENELDVLQQWYLESYPSYANQAQKTFELDTFQQQLKPDQKIIKYVVAAEKVYAFTITKEDVELYEIGNVKDITYTTRNLVRSLTNIESRDYIDLARKAYKNFLPESVLNSEEKYDLIFILDDILLYLPMEVLIDENNNFLIKNYKISYTSSLLLFNEQLKVKGFRKNRLGVFAPKYKKKSFNPKRNDSTQLFGANQEALVIAKLFNASSFIGDKANKQSFMNEAADFGVLHLAMHSTVNNTVPEFSNLSFAPNSKDNKLFVSELYGIPLNAQLAVLSACNTGSGELKKGEGILNISRAFTYAGVPSTVASLWSVPDKETSTIMVAFYKYLKEGKPKNEALQLAKLDYLHNTDDAFLEHPYFWAGFTLNGNVSSIEITPEPQIWKYLLIISLVVLLLYLFRKRLLQFF